MTRWNGEVVSKGTNDEMTNPNTNSDMADFGRNGVMASRSTNLWNVRELAYFMVHHTIVLQSRHKGSYFQVKSLFSLKF